MDLENLIGRSVEFFGISESHTNQSKGEAFLIKLGANAFQINRYEPDSWRSMCGEIETVDLSSYQKLEFFKFSLAKVRVEVIEECDGLPAEGYRLVDIKDGHVWLTFGTVYYDEWYPYFYHSYEPKPQY